jgi:hypothetical protein
MQHVVALHTCSDAGWKPVLRVLSFNPQHRPHYCGVFPSDVLPLTQDCNLEDEQLLDSHPHVDMATGTLAWFDFKPYRLKGWPALKAYGFCLVLRQ